jgi:tRNA pseudouridine38-40 synthase
MISVEFTSNFYFHRICESRKYTYFFPTYLLIPPKPGSSFHQKWTDNGGDPTLLPPYSFWTNHELTNAESLTRKRAWRIGAEQVVVLRQLAAKYEGTHNFHNFTVGREVKDRSNMRYMKKVEVADPVVYGETEWISVLFHGQSFMLHQVCETHPGSLP